MKKRALVLSLLGGVVAGHSVPGEAAAASPFSMNGWQFHEYHVPKLEQAVRRAPDYGVNFLIFSHSFFRSVEGFLASTDDADPNRPPAWAQELAQGAHFRIIPGWQSDLRRIGNLATQKGIPYYLWIHEFDDVPKRFLCRGRVTMNDPALDAYLRTRYQRLLAAVPGTAGFVLTLHESDLKVFRHADVESSGNVAERIFWVTKLIYDVAKKHGKKLILRNFFYEPQEMAAFKEAIDRLPDDIVVMSKTTTHEFHPFYPWDPQHGKVGKKKQIVEIDLGIEKAWDWPGAYAQTDFIRRAVARARDTKLAGMVGRARLFWDDPFTDSHEVNLHAFALYMANPDRTVDDVLTDWAKRRYPKRAIPHIVSAMKRSEFINHYGRWHLGYWFTKEIGREWSDYPYIYSRVLLRSRFKWTHSEADRRLEKALYHPDDATFAAAMDEKDKVVGQARAALSDLAKASRYLTADQLAPLREDFRFLLDASLLTRQWVRAYFAHRQYVDDPQPRYRQTMESALNELERLEKTPGVLWGLNRETGRRHKIGGFVRALRARSADLRAARREDRRILELSRMAADVENR